MSPPALPTDRGAGARGPGPLLVPAALYILLAALLCSAALADPRGRLVGSGADSIQRLWFLTWVPFAVSHRLDPLVTSYLDHPLRVNLMWNNATPVLGLLAWPLTAAAGAAVAFDALMVAALAGSAWVTALVARRYVRSALAAGAAGLLYGFSPYMVGEAAGGHLPLVVAVTPPVLIALAELIWVRGRTSIGLGIALGLVLAVQLLTSEELLTTLVLVAGLSVVAIALVGPRQVLRPPPGIARPLTAAAVTFALGAAWPLLIQLHGPGSLAGAALQPPGRFVTDLVNLVVPTRLLLLAPSVATRLTAHLTAGLAESGGYLGLPLIVLLLWGGVVRRRDPWARALLLALLVVAVASLGPTLHVAGRSTGVPLPWRLVQGWPLVSNVLPARLMLYCFLAASLLLAQALDRLATRWPGPRGATLAGVVAATTLIPLVPIPLPRIPAAVPAFFRSPAVDRIAAASVVVVVPIPTIGDARAMLWQAAAMRFQMPFGYVIHRGPGGIASENRLSPPLARALVTIEFGGRPTPPSVLAAAVRRELRVEGVDWIVVGPMLHEQAALGYLTRLLGRAPAPAGAVEIWRLAPERRPR